MTNLQNDGYNSEFNSVFCAIRPVVETWGINLVSENNEKATNEDFRLMLDSIVENVESMCFEFPSTELNEVVERENGETKEFTGWAYLHNSNSKKSDHDFNIQVAAEKDVDIDVKILLKVSEVSENSYTLSSEDFEEALEAAENDQALFNDINTDLNSFIEKGQGTLLIGEVLIDYTWHVEE